MSFEIVQLKKQIAELRSQCDELIICAKVQADNVSSLTGTIARMQDSQDMLLRCIKGLESRIGR